MAYCAKEGTPAMYQGASPIFDIPEFPTLRRLKPLPKRRRTSAQAPPVFLSPEVTAEDLIVQADTLSARMTLQNYYLPMLDGVHDYLSSTAGLGPDGMKEIEGMDFSLRLPDSLVDSPLQGRDDEDDHDDVDYIDHLRHPGNTKKRKVPANAFSSHRASDDTIIGQDEPASKGIPTGRAYCGTVEVIHTPLALNTISQKRGKLTAATQAGLQHKEMLKSRKRQLAAVLGALSHGDTLALDQALSMSHPFGTRMAGGAFDDLKNSQPLRIRLSKRWPQRLTRLARMTRQRSIDVIPALSSDFTFVCPSATADRLIATKEEVAMLRNRFEAELERQAAKAARLAASNKLRSSSLMKDRSRRGECGQERMRTSTNGKSDDQPAELPNTTPVSTKPRGRKKRSALANASNPHHLRNYVPSRLPHSGSANAGQGNGQNALWPLPLRFLSAEMSSQRRKRVPTQPIQPLTNPAEEWICAFCEYDLFYGNEQAYRRAVRNRKKILGRRRRARKRAAAAASGAGSAKVAEKRTSGPEDPDEGGYDAPVDDLAGSKLAKGDLTEHTAEQASYG